ncbi:MAG TPA: hypothetical protein VIK58_20310 [Caldimonas sp.]
MRACGTALQLAAAAILAGAAPAASAQSTYLCTSNGRTWQSVQPCSDGTAAPPRTVIVPRSEPRLPPLPGEAKPADKATEYLQFQNPRCAELSEGVRTGASRGLSRATQQELLETYRQQCAGEESRARTLLQDERNRQRDAREREERAARLELDRDKLNREQCAEMKRILQSKRQRLETMTPGERSDFERFEATWRGRCSP